MPGISAIRHSLSRRRRSAAINSAPTVLSQAQRAQVTDPIVQKLLPLIPLPNSPGNAYISSAVAPPNIHQGTANFTQQFTERNRFNAYYAMVPASRIWISPW